MLRSTRASLRALRAGHAASKVLWSKAATSRTSLGLGVSKRTCGLLAAVDNVCSPDYAHAGPSKASILADEYTLSAATGTMLHRGPDGRHTARGNLSPIGGVNSHSHSHSPQWAMGHQRLAIVDPDSHAVMPFLLKNLKLAADGEIYNHNSLFDKIVSNHGCTESIISKSDCEVIAHAFAAMGTETAVKHLDGMFTFCLFEEASEDGSKPAMTFAARDPVGVMPLYYGSTDDGAYVFASERKALVCYVVLSSVKAVPPGHYWTPQTGLVRYHTPEWNSNVSRVF